MIKTLSTPFREGASKATKGRLAGVLSPRVYDTARKRWLWDGWLARGKLQIIGGVPGVGKTTATLSMGATVSAGGTWPDGGVFPKGNVIIWSGEDDHADTLVPQLRAAGADMDQVFFAAEDEKRAFDPATDFLSLKTQIEIAGGSSLIVIDPIVAVSTGDSHKNAETRKGLQPIIDMAASLGAAVLGVTHFTKGTKGRSPIDRITGSMAYGAAPRVVMAASQQQTSVLGEPASRSLVRVKSNIGLDIGGYSYQTQMKPVPGYPYLTASVVVWGDYLQGTASEILAETESTSDGDGGAGQEAEAYLLDFLKDGPKPANDCKKAASEAALSLITVRRAKAKLNIASRKIGLSDGWECVLPER